MATIQFSSLQLSNPFSSPFGSSTHKPHPHTLLNLPKLHHPSPTTTFAADPETPPSDSDPKTSQPSSDAFDSRLNQVRIRYRSGTGKKAELRKGKKSKKAGSAGAGIYLPPVPLKEPVGSDGLKVDFGFSPYSERINGRIALLGLAALVLVELATGKSVLNYHTPAVVLIQLYFVATVGAIYVKYEKEKISVWPQD